MNTEYQKEERNRPLLVVILVSCPIYGAIPAASRLEKMMTMGRLISP